MSHPKNEQPTNASYGPLPFDEHIDDTLYDAPPSPGGLPQTAVLPAGAAAPEVPSFLGAYEHSDIDAPGSYPSSHRTFPSGGGGRVSEYSGTSIYPLNNDQDFPQYLYSGGYRDDPQGSRSNGEPDGIGMSTLGPGRPLAWKRETYADPRIKSKRKIMIIAVLASLVVLFAAVFIPLYFVVIRSKMGKIIPDNGGSSTAQPSSTAKPGPPSVAVVTGGDGSKVTTDSGSSFTYSNSFGGYWYWDVNDPFNNGAKAQSWTPALNETFHYGVDKIRGVPALFENYLNNTPLVVDEWTLSQAMAADTARGGMKQLEEHYKTFITEKDFAEIAGAGLNYVRIPLGYWAIETRGDEPFLPKTSWTYFLKAIQWARKYGLRINLDFHSLPGSQNEWNHSGRLGTVNMLNGPMGLANAQRSLDYIRIIAEFISQPQYRDVVTMFGIMNEPQETTLGHEQLSRFYLQAYKLVREASGVGEGKGPYISFHDAFANQDSWTDFLPNADRITLDSHTYMCFHEQSSAPMANYATTPCSRWGGMVNTTMGAFGLFNAGEFSNAVTDCGHWLTGIGKGSRYEGIWPGFTRVGSCDQWIKWEEYDATMKNSIKNFAMASMDALQNWFFWTWKVGNSSLSGKVESPAWSYQLGLENDWMPKNPTSANGVCGNTSPWTPPLKSWQTGGAGAGDIPASVSESLAWPPPTISNAGVTLLPSYTPTGAVPTLPGPSFTAAPGATITASPDVGNGWANPADTAGLMVNIAGCSSLDPWIGSSTLPVPLCSGGTVKRRLEGDWEDVPAPLITSPPA